MSKSQEVEAFGWACRDPSGVLSPFKFSRRTIGDQDVRLKVLYSGICRGDIMMSKDYRGREIVGVVTEVGKKVQKFKVGDKGGVGCFVGSCRKCESCANNLESHCPDQMSIGTPPYIDGMIIHGGFSDHIVTDEHFVFRWPDNLPLDSNASLLSAGITMYSPLKYFGLDKPGMHIGMVGLGGHGHLAVKIVKVFEGKVTVISTSLKRMRKLLKVLVLTHFWSVVQIALDTLDGIIDTVPAVHPLQPLIDLLKTHGKLVMRGGPLEPLNLPVCSLILGRKIVAGTDLGGLKETQEMLDFAAKHNITTDVEVIPIDYVNTAMERLEKGDVRYRFVLDVANTLKTT
ncbi:unnamed protein product [Ilex paraguariensis]|uniref:Uncharacterized protein n=1 Tax=Ilex paraguariensis TaxID=185542 RepID=A0ABC8SYV4_9AQUA